jgi:hypothetical protein
MINDDPDNMNEPDLRQIKKIAKFERLNTDRGVSNSLMSNPSRDELSNFSENDYCKYEQNKKKVVLLTENSLSEGSQSYESSIDKDS